MTDHVAGVAGVGGAQEKPLSAHELAAQTIDENIRAENLSSLAEQALSQAVSRPNAATPMDAARNELLGPASGEFADLKAGLVSEVERPGVAQDVDPDASSELQQTTEDRVQSLYYDLTNYQIAWKIAQRMQQDITQLMRG
jgi:hypothetical protein